MSTVFSMLSCHCVPDLQILILLSSSPAAPRDNPAASQMCRKIRLGESDCWKIFTDFSFLFIFVTVGLKKGMTERESGPACQAEALIMTGTRETTMKERDGGARDKSCDGNTCHINDSMPREVGNGVSSTSCLPVLQLGAPSPVIFGLSQALHRPFLFLHSSPIKLEFSSFYFLQWKLFIWQPISFYSVSAKSL